MGSNYPDHDPDESVKWLQEDEEGRSILKPRGLFIRWGNSSQYWCLPNPNQDGPAELLAVQLIEVSTKKKIDHKKSYQIGFRVSLSQEWKSQFPVFIMAKKQDGNYIARKETFEGRPVGRDKEFDIPDNFVIRFPPGAHRSSSQPMLHMTLCNQCVNYSWKHGLLIHHAFVKEAKLAN